MKLILLLGSRSSEVGGEVRTKNQFLTEMDGVNSKGKELDAVCDWGNKQTMES